MKKNKKIKIRLKIILSVFIAIVILLSGSIGAIYYFQQKEMQIQMKDNSNLLPLLFDMSYTMNFDLLFALIHSIAPERELQKAFLQKNRKKLYQKALPIYQEFFNQHEITHFYFHLPNNKNFLRIHRPERFGDFINRKTLSEASKTQKYAGGFELGPLGTFTLRVVLPWVIDNKIQGYIELGKEIERITSWLYEETGIEIVIILYKKFLKQNQWSQRLKIIRKNVHWERFDKFVIPYHTIDIDSNFFNQFIETIKENQTNPDYHYMKRSYFITSTGLYDFSNRKVGEMIFLNDITQTVSLLKRLSATLIGVAIFLTIGLFIFLWFYLGRMETSLYNTQKYLSIKVKDLEEAKTEVERSHEQYFNTLNNLKDVVIITSENEKVTFINNAARSFYNIQNIDKISLHSLKLNFFFCGDSKEILSKALKNTINTNRPVHIETLCSEKFFEYILAPVTIKEKTVSIVCVGRDITDRKSLEKDLIVTAQETDIARELADQASKAKTQFLAHMSHEIRTPLNAIIGMTDLALLSKDREEQFDYLVTVKQSSEHLLTIINDILDFSKIESGEIRFEEIDIDLFDLILNIKKILSIIADKKNIPINLEMDEQIPRYIKGDPVRLKQILFNLISNAIKFTEKGYVHIVIALNKDAPNQASNLIYPVQFKILDTGIGIAEDKLNLIFESFVQSDLNTTRKYGGTGLGLSISKKLVEMMGGKLEARSNVNEGSQFYFTLLIKEGIEPKKIKSQKMNFLIDLDKSFNILLVEDNPVNILLANTFLKRMGHRTQTAVHGKKALEIYKNQAFDLILMDIEMPEMDGMETTKRIRNGECGQGKKDIPIIAMTAHAVQEILDDCYHIGMNNCIVKPIRIEKLSTIINETMNKDRIANQ